jgi:hypothetical protein
MLLGKEYGEHRWVICYTDRHSECPLIEGIPACHAADMADFEANDPLNRVQFETRSASLPKPLRGRRSDPKSMGLELDAV